MVEPEKVVDEDKSCFDQHLNLRGFSVPNSKEYRWRDSIPHERMNTGSLNFTVGKCLKLPK